MPTSDLQNLFETQSIAGVMREIQAQLNVLLLLREQPQDESTGAVLDAKISRLQGDWSAIADVALDEALKRG